MMRHERLRTTEKSIALREIRKTDFSRYVEICRVLRKEDFEEDFETVPLEYVHDLADDGPTVEDEVFAKEKKSAITEVLAALSPREEMVLRMRFGIDMPTEFALETVGIKFSVTRERIRQIEAKVLRKLKHSSLSGNLKEFLLDAA